MLKICSDIICKPLALIFKQALTTGCFCLNGKMTKKATELPPSFSTSYLRENFERLIFNEMFSFLLANNLLAPNQAGFKPGVFLLMSFYPLVISHEIYSSFDDGSEVRSVFLHISSAFDKVWDYI